jgi:hypothetical protein
MTTLQIRDMAAQTELDRAAMTEVRGGMLEGLLGDVKILSPELFNKVTPIVGIASIPTVQTNNLAQVDNTVATNGLGINFVSNNKFASQSNSNNVFDVNNPFVG